jgi:hypothetical protein
MTMVTGLFKDKDSAELAFQSVVDLGYGKGNINVVMSEKVRQRYLLAHDPTATELEEAAAADANDTESTAGPPALALAASAAAGVAMGLMPILVNWGIPDSRVKQYEAGVRARSMGVANVVASSWGATNSTTAASPLALWCSTSRPVQLIGASSKWCQGCEPRGDCARRPLPPFTSSAKSYGARPPGPIWRSMGRSFHQAHIRTAHQGFDVHEDQDALRFTIVHAPDASDMTGFDSGVHLGCGLDLLCPEREHVGH